MENVRLEPVKLSTQLDDLPGYGGTLLSKRGNDMWICHPHMVG
jgi:hypothetical protein